MVFVLLCLFVCLFVGGEKRGGHQYRNKLMWTFVVVVVVVVVVVFVVVVGVGVVVVTRYNMGRCPHKVNPVGIS